MKVVSVVFTFESLDNDIGALVHSTMNQLKCTFVYELMEDNGAEGYPCRRLLC